MKQLVFIFCICMLFLTCENQPDKKTHELKSRTEKNDYDYKVRVIGISDGDTFKGLTDKNEQIKFRIYAIDAPEKKQAFGNRSKQYLSGLIFNKTAGIKYQTTDQYGRQVVWVYTPDGKDVSAEMLKAGMAWHYKRYDATPEYAAYEIEAQKSRLGLWADKHPVAPWDFRKQKKSEKKGAP